MMQDLERVRRAPVGGLARAALRATRSNDDVITGINGGVPRCIQESLATSAIGYNPVKDGASDKHNDR